LNSFDNDRLILSVKDNGPGIPEHMRDKIFDPFFTTKEVGKGTGVGLGIVNQLVEDMNGKIQYGDEFIERARKLPNGDGLYFMITGGVAAEYSQDPNIKADGYILKPFTSDALYKTLAKGSKNQAGAAS
jgi:hypothetical protein